MITKADKLVKYDTYYVSLSPILTDKSHLNYGDLNTINSVFE